jgi:hypothetical protein
MRSGSSLRAIPAARLLGSVGLVLLLTALGGCSRPVVSGTVTYKQNPLTRGEVSFIADDGKSRSGLIGADGNYEIVDPPLGDVKIVVVATTVEGKAGKASPILGNQGGAPPVVKSLIPVKYNSPQTSGLTYQVTGGKQTRNIDLDD